jgi:hypothetical protein
MAPHVFGSGILAEDIKAHKIVEFKAAHPGVKA